MPGSEVAKCLDGDLTFRGCGGGRVLEGPARVLARVVRKLIIWSTELGPVLVPMQPPRPELGPV